MHHLVGRRALLSLSLLAAACAVDDPDDDGAAGPDTASAADGAKVDAVDLRIRAGNLTLWVEREAALTFDTDGEPTLAVRGRTSRNLASVRSWVPDDAFGEVEQTAARRFVLRLRGGHEVNSVLSGMPILLAFETIWGAVKHHDARVVLAPRLPGDVDADGVHLDPYVRPVFVGGADPLRYRLGALYAVGPVTASPGAPLISDDADDIAAIDWTYGGFAEVLEAGEVEVHAADAAITAAIEIHAVELAMTIEDPGAVWPSPACETAVRECVESIDVGGDLGDCGDYRQVEPCVDAPE